MLAGRSGAGAICSTSGRLASTGGRGFVLAAALVGLAASGGVPIVSPIRTVLPLFHFRLLHLLFAHLAGVPSWSGSHT